jgi:hypothetical protein
VRHALYQDTLERNHIREEHQLDSDKTLIEITRRISKGYHMSSDTLHFLLQRDEAVVGKGDKNKITSETDLPVQRNQVNGTY